MNVFVVDSDADLRALLEEMIGANHSVRVFACGRAALAELVISPPDLLLTDLSLCGVSGEDLARAAARLPNPPRIVLMSADHKRLQRSEGLAQARLEKPFVVRELADALGTAY
jgi:two-component system response regulator BaeR